MITIFVYSDGFTLKCRYFSCLQNILHVCTCAMLHEDTTSFLCLFMIQSQTPVSGQDQQPNLNKQFINWLFKAFIDLILLIWNIFFSSLPSQRTVSSSSEKSYNSTKSVSPQPTAVVCIDWLLIIRYPSVWSIAMLFKQFEVILRFFSKAVVPSWGWGWAEIFNFSVNLCKSNFISVVGLSTEANWELLF